MSSPDATLRVQWAEICTVIMEHRSADERVIPSPGSTAAPGGAGAAGAAADVPATRVDALLAPLVLRPSAPLLALWDPLLRFTISLTFAMVRRFLS